MYSLLIITYIKDPKEKLHLLHAIETVPCIQRKANWALKWCNSTSVSFSKQMIAFAAIEGIFFSGSLCAIFWLKKCGLMPGLGLSSKLISRNKGLHCDFAFLLYFKLTNGLPKKCIINISSSVVDINMGFIVNSLPVELIGMNSIMMCNYIICVDQLLIALGCSRYYKAGNPFEWMEAIDSKGKQILSKNASADIQYLE
jgi:ribonucleoside-diphosphate reductase subunit M2